MKTLLAILRLIRLPLLFTALADATVVVVIIAKDIHWPALEAVWGATAGLYLFGVALNDVIDARRDRATEASGAFGRVNPVAGGDLPAPAALAIALLGALLAFTAAWASEYVNITMTATAAGLILAYNLGLKRFPPIGLPILGAIRAAWAAQGLVGDDMLTLWAVPAVIAAHTVFVSAFAYAWEGRKPPLYGNNWLHLLAVCAAALVGLGMAPDKWGAGFWPADRSLSKVYLTWALFIAVFGGIFARLPRTQRGQVLRFFGLVWLILLDYSFVLAAGVTQPGLIFVALLACVFVSVQAMRMLARFTGRTAN